MIVVHWLKMNLSTYGRRQRITVSQWDAYTRQIGLQLFAGTNPWEIPEGVKVMVFYHKPDGTSGEYDTLPNGETAWIASGNKLRITLAPQMLAAKGTVVMYARLMLGNSVLNTFDVEIHVTSPGKGMGCGERIKSEDYHWITGVLPAPEEAKAGQFVRVMDVDEKGRVMRVDAVDLPSAGGTGSRIVNVRIEEVD